MSGGERNSRGKSFPYVAVFTPCVRFRRLDIDVWMRARLVQSDDLSLLAEAVRCSR